MEAVCGVLEQLVRDGTLKRYAVGGATAAGFPGEPLATRDFAVFVFLEPPPASLLVTLEPLYSRLCEMGFTEFEEEGLLIHGLPVQFLSASPGLEAEAVKQALVVEWDGHRMRVMRPDHLAAIARTVGRPKDRAGVVYLAELPDFARNTFSRILSRPGLKERWIDWATALGLGV